MMSASFLAPPAAPTVATVKPSSPATTSRPADGPPFGDILGRAVEATSKATGNAAGKPVAQAAPEAAPTPTPAAPALDGRAALVANVHSAVARALVADDTAVEGDLAEPEAAEPLDTAASAEASRLSASTAQPLPSQPTQTPQPAQTTPDVPASPAAIAPQDAGPVVASAAAANPQVTPHAIDGSNGPVDGSHDTHMQTEESVQPQAAAPSTPRTPQGVAADASTDVSARTVDGGPASTQPGMTQPTEHARSATPATPATPSTPAPRGTPATEATLAAPATRAIPASAAIPATPAAASAAATAPATAAAMSGMAASLAASSGPVAELTETRVAPPTVVPVADASLAVTATAPTAATATADAPLPVDAPFSVRGQAVIQRIALLAKQLENAPPPRSILVEMTELPGLRIEVRLAQDGGVHVLAQGPADAVGPLGSIGRELATALGERGLSLGDFSTRDDAEDNGASGQASDREQNQRQRAATGDQRTTTSTSTGISASGRQAADGSVRL